MKNIGKYIIAGVATAALSIGCLLTLPKVYAEDYYSKANYTSGQLLQKSLTEIISAGTHDVGYAGLWTAYKTTDLKPGTNYVWDMYSNENFDVDKGHGSSYSKEGDCYNREHSIPQSWFSGDSPMKADLFHVYPTDGYVNNRRSSYVYGEVGSATYTSKNGSKLGSSSFSGYSGTVFEPIDEYKGDFARTYFYMATRYSSKVGNWTKGEASKIFKGSYPYLTDYAINLFTKWDKLDPVSEKEINRNNAVYSIQHNRNPFIDHPQYVDYIFRGVPIGTDPTGSTVDVSTKPSTQTSTSTSTQTSTNTSTSTSTKPIVDGDQLQIVTTPTAATGGYKKNVDFTFGNYTLNANACYVDDDCISNQVIRIGSNTKNILDIPSKYNVTGFGGVLETKFELENVSKIDFSILKEYQVDNWYVAASTDNGDTWTTVGEGLGKKIGTNGGTYSVTIDSPIAKAKYALIVSATGENACARAEVKSITFTFAKQAPNVNTINDLTTNQYLDINYKVDANNNPTVTSVKMGLSFTLANKDVLEDALYGFILVETPAQALNIEALYDNSDAKTFIAKYGKFLEATMTSATDSSKFRATFTPENGKTYLAVGVAIVDGKLYFANQNNLLSVSEVATQLISSKLVTNELEVAILRTLQK